jgi:hypothetical protein
MGMKFMGYGIFLTSGISAITDAVQRGQQIAADVEVKYENMLADQVEGLHIPNGGN